jgi:heat shock protein HslJ
MRLFIGILTLAIGGLLLAACSSSSGSALTGKTWQWTGSTTTVPASQSVVPDPENYTITFNTDGTFSGKADCNQVSGDYTTSGSDLTITPGPTTMMACPEGSLDGLFLEGIGKASSYTISGSDLTITDSDEGTMQFVAAS